PSLEYIPAATCKREGAKGDDNCNPDHTESLTFVPFTIYRPDSALLH
ncbi:MAG: hypothetical protein ACI8Z9_002620, partial [Paraglaciecola sp.]